VYQLRKVGQNLAQGCRNMVQQQLGGDLGHSSRGANSFGKAARDPEQTIAAQ
jgi:hypothetical protein